ncbi:hypothetical protein SDC9_124607 [bioreactor metagenome]|uniref:Uncharacterized protein n=1 Tax=bioreactor metagenome TaxID=1076179 RepID=A0A645CKX0_9ZZZZ
MAVGERVGYRGQIGKGIQMTACASREPRSSEQHDTICGLGKERLEIDEHLLKIGNRRRDFERERQAHSGCLRRDRLN